MSHLTPDELVDAVERTLAPGRRAHLDSCATCHHEAAQLEALLANARAIDVPEPSPLFWDRFSDRVREAIASEPLVRPRWHWLQWPVLVPVAGLAVLVLALVSAVPRGPAVATPALIAEDSAPALESEPEVDTTWAFVSEVVGPLDFEMAEAVGIATAPGAAELAALHLSDEERVELVRLLQQELGRPGG
jgi:hypothetical protein